MRIQAEASATYARVDHERAELLEHVDDVDFVARHVGGVFDAIIDSSIAQMEAYGELLESVSKSVEDYKRDNIDGDDDDDDP